MSDRIKNNRCEMTRRGLLACLGLGVCSVAWRPADARALQSSLADAEDSKAVNRFIIEDQDPGVKVVDNETGETVYATKMPGEGGASIVLNYDNGDLILVDSLGNDLYVDGVLIASLELSNDASDRTCVKMTSNRYQINSDALSLGSIIAAITAKGLNLPYAVISSIASAIAAVATLNKPRYFETISYYCDSPKKMMRYVTNFYTDPGYKNKVHTQVSEVEFQTP